MQAFGSLTALTACSAAIEVLKILKDEQIIEKANKHAVYFNNIIKEKFLPLENVGEVRSIGLINAIELVKNRDTKEPLDYKKRTGYQIYKKALEKGVLLRPLGDVIYFNPPLCITAQTNGILIISAIDCASCMITLPGPAVAVNARLPAKIPPIVEKPAEISSSVCKNPAPVFGSNLHHVCMISF